MIRALLTRLSRFAGREDGNATVEFVLVFPLFLSLMIMSIELGFVTLRHTMLERGLDIAVREIRLGTGTAPQHDDIKKMICDNALMIADCENSLQLEMIRTDPYAFNSFNQDPLCTDKSEETEPVRDADWNQGVPNELMVLRACLKYDPLFPDRALGSALSKDAFGQVSIVTTTAFVQEPL